MLKMPREIPGNYILNPEKSFFSIVVPEEGTNLVINPEVYDFYGYTANGETDLIADAHYGLNCIRTFLKPKEEVNYTIAATLEQHTSYTFSVSIKGVNTVELQIYAGTKYFARALHKTTDFWSRYSVTVHVGKNDIINPKFAVLTKDGGTVDLSAWQVEQKPYATTFISGNLSGFNPSAKPIPYYWTGVPHRSPSVRTKFTRDGGKIVNFTDMGIHVTGYDGFGLPDFDHTSITLVNKPGSVYRDSIIESRDLTILGILYSKDFDKFFEHRSVITSSLSPFLTHRPQPIKLLFQLVECELPLSEVIELGVVYAGGLDGSFNSAYGETLSIDFTMFDPFMYRSGNKSYALCLEQASNNPGLVYRNKNGVWGTTPPLADVPKALEIGADNNLYVGVDVSFNIGAALVYRFDGINMTGIGFSGEETDVVYTIEQGLDNKLYVGGSFNSINGIGSGNAGKFQNLMRFNLRNGLWENFGNVFHTNPAIGPSVQCIKQLSDGRLAIVGRFDRADTPTTTSTVCRNIAIYNPATLAMETLDGATLTGIGGTSQILYTVNEDLQGYLWVGGQFTETIGPHTCKNIARFQKKGNGKYEHYRVFTTYIENLERRTNRTSLVTLGQDKVLDIELDGAGNIYAAGMFDATSFTNAVEATLPGTEFTASNPFFITKFDGNLNWVSLGLVATLNPPSPQTNGTAIHDLEYDPSTRQMFFAGYFNYAGAAKYLTIDNPSSSYTTITARNPADNLSDYESNTTSLAKTNGTILLPEPIFTPTANVFPSNMEKIKIGGFYPAFSYISTFNLPPSALSGLSDAGYINTFFTNMRSQPISLICTTEVPIECSDIVFPVLTITGPGELISLRNYDGGLAPINFNKTLLEGEILVIDWTSAVPLISSNLFGNQNNIIMPGSSLSTFRLLKGLNHVSLFMRSTTINANTKAYLTWRQTFIDLDSAVSC